MNRSGSYLLDMNIVIALFAGDRSVETKARNTADVALAPPNNWRTLFWCTEISKSYRESSQNQYVYRTAYSFPL